MLRSLNIQNGSSLSDVVPDAGITSIYAPILLAALQLFSPTLRAWMRWDSNMERIRDQNNRVKSDRFDFIVGKTIDILDFKNMAS